VFSVPLVILQQPMGDVFTPSWMTLATCPLFPLEPLPLPILNSVCQHLGILSCLYYAISLVSPFLACFLCLGGLSFPYSVDSVGLWVCLVCLAGLSFLYSVVSVGLHSRLLRHDRSCCLWYLTIADISRARDKCPHALPVSRWTHEGPTAVPYGQTLYYSL
jgi:hypothetical protein